MKKRYVSKPAADRDTIAALRWITDILHTKKIPFQITGGLAAIVYGSHRELADIDLDVPEEYFDSLVPDIQQYLLFGPEDFRDEHWDLRLMTLEYQGQLIDIGGASHAKIFDRKKGMWVNIVANVAAAETQTIFDISLPFVPKQDLLWYKSILDRDVDREDVASMETLAA